MKRSIMPEPYVVSAHVPLALHDRTPLRSLRVVVTELASVFVVPPPQLRTYVRKGETMASILIVEDRPLDRKFLSRLLESDGHVVTGASDGGEALTLVLRTHPDLVISDILMPTVDGFEFVRRLRENSESADIPVIFYTATYHEREAQSLARQCGVVDILTKPSNPKTILDKVNAALEHGLR